MKVLIADDSITMRRIIAGMLGELGYRDIVEVDCGEDCLRALGAHGDVGLALLDWNMPLMNGLDCLKAIRGNPETAATPVVIVTSDASKSSVMEALRSGANSYLIKPFVVEKLKEIIDGLKK